MLSEFVRKQKKLTLQILVSVFLKQPMISYKDLVASVEDNPHLSYYVLELKSRVHGLKLAVGE